MGNVCLTNEPTESTLRIFSRHQAAKSSGQSLCFCCPLLFYACHIRKRQKKTNLSSQGIEERTWNSMTLILSKIRFLNDMLLAIKRRFNSYILFSNPQIIIVSIIQCSTEFFHVCATWNTASYLNHYKLSTSCTLPIILQNPAISFR